MTVMIEINPLAKPRIKSSLPHQNGDLRRGLFHEIEVVEPSLQAVITACYTEHRVAALNDYWTQNGKTTESAKQLITEFEKRFDGPVCPSDIYVPPQIEYNTQIVRRYLKDQFAQLHTQILEITDQTEICDTVSAFTKKHHKHLAWAHADNGLFAANEGMNVRIRRYETLENGEAFVDWFGELGFDSPPEMITQKHILSKGDRESLINPLLAYGFSHIEPLTDGRVTTRLTEKMYAHALLTNAAIIKHSQRDIPAQMSGDTWTLDPHNFEPVKKLDGSFYDGNEPMGKPFAPFSFILKPEIAGQAVTRRRIGTATKGGEYDNQWNFAAADPRRKDILESEAVNYDLGVYGQIRLKAEFVPAMESLAQKYGMEI